MNCGCMMLMLIHLQRKSKNAPSGQCYQRQFHLCQTGHSHIVPLAPFRKIMSERGIALITALLLSVFLLILGIFFLTFIERDSYFASTQKSHIDAYFLCQSGVEYYKTTGLPNTDGTLLSLNVPAGDTQKVVTIERLAGGDIVFTGRILGFLGTVRAQRALIAPLGDLNKIYER